MIKERRRHARLRLPLEAHYRVKADDDWREGTIEILGAGGAALICDRKLKTGDALAGLRFAVGAAGTFPPAEIEVAAEVVQVNRRKNPGRKDSFVLGLQFADIEREQQDHLRQFIFQRLTGSEPPSVIAGPRRRELEPEKTTAMLGRLLGRAAAREAKLRKQVEELEGRLAEAEPAAGAAEDNAPAAEVEALHGKIEELEGRLAEAEAAAGAAQGSVPVAEVEALQGKIERLEGRLAEAEAAAGTAQESVPVAEVEALRCEIERLETSRQEAVAEQEGAEARAERAREIQAELADELRQAQDEVERLRLESEDKETNLRAELERQRAAGKQLAERLEAASKAEQALRERIAESDAGEETLLEQVEAAMAGEAAQREQLETVTAEGEQLRERLEAATVEQEELRHQLHETTASEEALRERLEATTTGEEELRQRLEQTAASEKDLFRRLEEIEGGRDELERQLEEARAAVAEREREWDGERSELRDELERRSAGELEAREALDKAVGLETGLREQLAEAEREREALAERLQSGADLESELRRRIETLEGKLRLVEENREELTRELTAAAAERDRLRAQAEALRTFGELNRARRRLGEQLGRITEAWSELESGLRAAEESIDEAGGSEAAEPVPPAPHPLAAAAEHAPLAVVMESVDEPEPPAEPLVGAETAATTEIPAQSGLAGFARRAVARLTGRRPAPAAGAELEEESDAPPPAAAADAPADAAEVEETVRAWAAAWSEQRVDDYLSFYSREFTPQADGNGGGAGGSKPVWFPPLNGMELTVGPIAQTELAPGRIGVHFEQSVETDSYTRRVGRTLELVREADGWKIAAESFQDSRDPELGVGGS